MKTTLESWLKKAKKQVNSNTPELDSELLLAFRLQKNRAYLRAFGNTPLPADIQQQLQTDLQRLRHGYPLAYLLGKKAFWDMTLTVTEDTLIPRPDTETLVEVVLSLLPPSFDGRLLDLGTGSGAIAIALSRERPDAKIYACDMHQAALNVAARNAQRWQRAPITFFRSDWFNVLDKAHGSNPLQKPFTLIVANPPYIAPQDPHLAALTFEPTKALIAKQDGLADIRQIITRAPYYLLPNGWLIVEHGYNQGQAVRGLFTSAGKWQEITTHRDLSGNERASVARLG
ncbi:MAG: protein-(glutamine-N5) methyltransferase, release factor-specific [Gammaproteobacteria bacterium]|nr:MAG: protein-(glutamine-N5) methyltransferase, release factor-specific [Gammaproteobacteria bacterium]